MSNRFGFALLLLAACGGGTSASSAYWPPPSPSPSPSPSPGGTPGNIGIGGAQDFAAFRAALDQGTVPQPQMLDSSGFFAEHYNALPAPTCGQSLCLHGLLSVSPDLVKGGTWTLLQLGMSSPIDPSTVTRPPLDLVVVLDRSGSMADDDKMVYALAGLKALVEQLGEDDTLTIIAFNSSVQTVYGPARVSNVAAIEAEVDGIYPTGGTNIYDALQAGYRAALAGGDERQLRRVIFVTDGLPTVGDTSDLDIERMSQGYAEQHVGLTTIGVGHDAGLGLLRALAVNAGGNFYFVENAAAIHDVFDEEFKLFVAPLAYDVDLSFDVGSPYAVRTLYGTSLWQRTAGGGRVHVPSVYLTSRQSDEPGPGGGRRGGGAAIIADLSPIADALAGHTVATLHLRYRLPGATRYETQDLAVTYANRPGICDGHGFYSRPEIDTNTAILGFYVAFSSATQLAQTDRAGARRLLQHVRPALAERIAGMGDEDLDDDLSILDEYIAVLAY
jgi:Ca-activated chloride channel homolog